mmetsp:Transcript_17726/g.35377  ORF Transcript_17726/g.35377 Transcript_17726/m.35377 type:complete len:219 (+) Transcript_17726:263-919(+)
MCNSNECVNSAGQRSRQSTDESLVSNRVATCCSSTDSISASVFHLPLHRNPSLPELISVNNNAHQEILPSRESSVSEFCDARLNETPCDACPFCNDTCTNSACRDCRLKCVNDPFLSVSAKDRCISCCELRRHDNINSAWLLIDKNIYDVTDYIEKHPGGRKSILKYSGGVKNCREDMNFHSKSAIKMLKAYKIGKISVCPGEVGSPSGISDDACSIM